MKKFRKTDILAFDEYSVYLRSSVHPCVSIKPDVISDKKKLGELCKLVCPSVKPKRENFKKIASAAATKCDMVLRHSDKFYASARARVDAELFFMDINVVRRDLGELRRIMEYVDYGGYMLNPGNKDSFCMPQRLQIEIRHLIDRVYDRVIASPDPAKEAVAQLSFFKQYAAELDDQSSTKLASKFNRFVS